MSVNIVLEEDGTKVLRTEVSSGQCKGWIIRAFNEVRKEYQMRDSHFDNGLHRWVSDVNVPLVQGRGTPLTLYMDLRSMQIFNIKKGELKTFIICRVHDWESIFHLAWLSKKYPQDKLSNLFSSTRLFKSRKNVIIQTGHKINDTKIDVDGAIFDRPEHLVSEYFITDEMKRLCDKYEITQQDTVFWNFNVIINVTHEL